MYAVIKKLAAMTLGVAALAFANRASASSVDVPVSFALSNLSVTAAGQSTPLGGFTGSYTFLSTGITRTTVQIGDDSIGRFRGTGQTLVTGNVQMTGGAVTSGDMTIGVKQAGAGSFDYFKFDFSQTMSSGIANQINSQNGETMNFPTENGHFSSNSMANHSLDGIQWWAPMAGSFLTLHFDPTGTNPVADIVQGSFAAPVAVPLPPAVAAGGCGFLCLLLGRLVRRHRRLELA